jgi:hypothetical protein
MENVFDLQRRRALAPAAKPKGPPEFMLRLPHAGNVGRVDQVQLPKAELKAAFEAMRGFKRIAERAGEFSKVAWFLRAAVPEIDVDKAVAVGICISTWIITGEMPKTEKEGQ